MTGRGALILVGLSLATATLIESGNGESGAMVWVGFVAGLVFRRWWAS